MSDMKVRPLEWVTQGLGILYAYTIVGCYHVNEDGVWWLSSERTMKAANVEAAKAAIWADYQRRILSALEPSP